MSGAFSAIGRSAGTGEMEVVISISHECHIQDRLLSWGIDVTLGEGRDALAALVAWSFRPSNVHVLHREIPETHFEPTIDSLDLPDVS